VTVAERMAAFMTAVQEAGSSTSKLNSCGSVIASLFRVTFSSWRLVLGGGGCKLFIVPKACPSVLGGGAATTGWSSHDTSKLKDQVGCTSCVHRRGTFQGVQPGSLSIVDWIIVIALAFTRYHP
jgi:hypothetical protein